MKIDKHIPAPCPSEARAGWPVYPFATMEIGDSFAVDAERATAAIGAAKKWRQRHPGWQHTWARENGSVRLWRTA